MKSALSTLGIGKYDIFTQFKKKIDLVRPLLCFKRIENNTTLFSNSDFKLSDIVEA